MLKILLKKYYVSDKGYVVNPEISFSSVDDFIVINDENLFLNSSCVP